MNILIAVPVFDYKDKFVRNFIEFWSELLITPKAYKCAYTFVYRQQLDIAQNRIAKEALAKDFTHILLIEDDIYGYTKVHLDKLLMDNLDIVCGACYGSEFPYDLLASRRFDKSFKYATLVRPPGKNLYEIPEPKGIQEVDLTHTGFSLIKTDVFRRLEYPYFDAMHEYNSDGYFYEKAQNAGFKVHVDCDVVLDHRGVTPKNVQLYKQLGMANDVYKGMEPDQVRVFKDEEEAKKYEEELKAKILVAEGVRVGGA